jgi:hypothetical protein
VAEKNLVAVVVVVVLVEVVAVAVKMVALVVVVVVVARVVLQWAELPPTRRRAVACQRGCWCARTATGWQD